MDAFGRCPNLNADFKDFGDISDDSSNADQLEEAAFPDWLGQQILNAGNAQQGKRRLMIVEGFHFHLCVGRTLVFKLMDPQPLAVMAWNVGRPSMKPLEEEPMLAARINIEDGFCLVDVDNIDRHSSSSIHLVFRQVYSNEEEATGIP